MAFQMKRFSTKRVHVMFNFSHLFPHIFFKNSRLQCGRGIGRKTEKDYAKIDVYLKSSFLNTWKPKYNLKLAEAQFCITQVERRLQHRNCPYKRIA